jgi:hypothetical protein
MLRDVPPGNVDPPYAVRYGEALVYRDGVRHAIAAVEDDARRPAASVEGEDGLDGGVKGGDVEGLEEDLGCCVAVATGVEGGFG